MTLASSMPKTKHDMGPIASFEKALNMSWEDIKESGIIWPPAQAKIIILNFLT
jgi:hypothetical protein